MSKNLTKLFPNNKGNLRSKTFCVGNGQFARLTGYDLCPGICMRISKVHENPCICLHHEKPYCIAGGQVGLDANCSDAVIPEKGDYVAYLCVADDVEIPEDFCIFLDICEDLDNLKVVIAASCCGDK